MAVLTEVNWRDGIDVEYPHVKLRYTDDDSGGSVFSIEGPTAIGGVNHAIINWAGTDSLSNFANAQYEVILKYTVNKF